MRRDTLLPNTNLLRVRETMVIEKSWANITVIVQIRIMWICARKQYFLGHRNLLRSCLLEKMLRNIFKKQLRNMASILDKFSVGLTNLLTKCTTTTL